MNALIGIGLVVIALNASFAVVLFVDKIFDRSLWHVFLTVFLLVMVAKANKALRESNDEI